MTNDGKLTLYVTPWAELFCDDIELLREFGEGDEFLRELNGDLVKFFACVLKMFAHLIFYGIRIRYWGHQTAASMCRQKRMERTKHTSADVGRERTISNVCPMSKTVFFFSKIGHSPNSLDASVSQRWM